MKPDPVQAARIAEGPFIDEKGRIDGFTAMDRKVLLEFLRNGGNRIAAVKAHTGERTPTGASVRAVRLFNLPQAKAFLRREMGAMGLIHDCVKLWKDGLAAEKTRMRGKEEVREPNWDVRLKTADQIMKASGMYDKPAPTTPAQEAAEKFIDVDWSETPPEVVKFYALNKRWPTREEEAKLLTDVEEEA